MKSKALLVIGAGVNQVPVITKAKHTGLRVVALDGDPKAPGLKLADHQYVVSTRDREAAIVIAREHAVDGVVSIASDIAVPTLAVVVDDLELPGITLSVAEKVTNKGEMRQHLWAAGVPAPAFGIATSVDDAQHIASRIGYPLIVKPVDRAGGYAITKVLEPSTLEVAFKRAQSSSFVSQAVLEELMVGAEICVDFMVFCGKLHIVGLSDTVASPPPVGVELRHIIPSMLSRKAQDECHQLTLRVIEALGLDNCAGFLEIMVTTSGCKVIEVAGRLSGLAENLIQVATGIDVTKAVIDIAMGREPNVKPAYNRAVAQLYIHPGKNGVIESISGIKAAEQAPGVQYVTLWVAPGDRVMPLSDNYARIGRLAAAGETRHKAITRAEYAMGLLRFQIVP